MTHPPSSGTGLPAPQTAVSRLAPSPTGRFHLGNLSSSLLAWVHARATGARLLLRIEDLDPPRVVAGATELILADMRALGIDWDGGALGANPAADAGWSQSCRQHLYRCALTALASRGLAYRCFCSRREIAEAASAPHSGQHSPVYPGTCASMGDDQARERAGRGDPFAWRFRAEGSIRFTDDIAGQVTAHLPSNPGDFIIARRDGLFAYQLAVVVDDAAMGVTHVLRGRDLLDSAPRQCALFGALDAPRPRFLHVPLLVDARGDRLSKRRRDVSLDGLQATGWNAAEVRGALAWLWGWLPEPLPLSPPELIDLWDPRPLDTPEVRVPDSFFSGPDALRAALPTLTRTP